MSELGRTEAYVLRGLVEAGGEMQRRDLDARGIGRRISGETKGRITRAVNALAGKRFVSHWSPYARNGALVQITPAGERALRRYDLLTPTSLRVLDLLVRNAPMLRSELESICYSPVPSSSQRAVVTRAMKRLRAQGLVIEDATIVVTPAGLELMEAGGDAGDPRGA